MSPPPLSRKLTKRFFFFFNFKRCLRRHWVSLFFSLFKLKMAAGHVTRLEENLFRVHQNNNNNNCFSFVAAYFFFSLSKVAFIFFFFLLCRPDLTRAWPATHWGRHPLDISSAVSLVDCRLKVMQVNRVLVICQRPWKFEGTFLSVLSMGLDVFALMAWHAKSCFGFELWGLNPGDVRQTSPNLGEKS